MAKMANFVEFWFKAEAASKRPVFVLFVCLVFVLYSVLCVLCFCYFLFTSLLVLMRQHSRVTKNIDLTVNHLGFAPGFTTSQLRELYKNYTS